MKKIFILMFCLFTFIGANAQSIDVNKEDLHPNMIEFIDTYFSDTDIVYCSVEYTTNRYRNVDEVEVKFANGTKVEFDAYGNLKSVDCEGNNIVPINILPKKILNYIVKNYPNAVVTDYSIERNSRLKILGYEVDLSTGYDLKFNKSYNCIYIERY